MNSLIAAAALSCLRTAVQERILALLRLYPLRLDHSQATALAPVFPTGAPELWDGRL
jgi:hypothetical protein